MASTTRRLDRRQDRHGYKNSMGYTRSRHSAAGINQCLE